MIKLLTTFAVLTISQPAFSDEIAAQQCADNMIALMQKDKNALGHKAVQVIKRFNETCEGLGLCSVDMHEDTAKYLDEATKEDGEPALPEVPIEGTFMADFDGFEDESYTDFVDSCVKEDAHINFYDFTVNLDGTAMDLVDVKVNAQLKSYPMCVVKECKGTDPEEVFEFALKHAIIANAPEMSEQQKTLINSMNIAMACAASGIETCELTIQAANKLIFDSSSVGIVTMRRWVVAAATLSGVWFSIV